MQPPTLRRRTPLLHVPVVPSVFVAVQRPAAARAEGAPAWLSAHSDAGEVERTDRHRQSGGEVSHLIAGCQSSHCSNEQ